MTPYHADEQVTLYHGDALAVLSTLPDQSVNCCVTSPPYFGLRDYGEEGQYGLEASPAEYVETMRAVFAQVRRVLADDGTLWLNIGDSYSLGNGRRPDQPPQTNAKRVGGVVVRTPRGEHASDSRTTGFGITAGVPPAKNLLGIPWRTAFALQDDGWLLRNDVIWAKPNAMPESVTDRLSTRHEHLFMFAKHARYWFDLDPLRRATLAGCPTWEERKAAGEVMRHGLASAAAVGPPRFASDERGSNPGDVWTVPTHPFAEAHFAVMPQALAERATLAGCKPGGTVLDPFSGSGTTWLAANKHSRRYVGIDLSSDYLDMSLRTRFGQPGLDLSGEATA